MLTTQWTKIGASLFFAMLLSIALIATVSAQTSTPTPTPVQGTPQTQGTNQADTDTDTDSETAENLPSIQPITTTVTQTVPVTLTFSIPGPTGPITVEVPIMLSLDIQIGFSNTITASVVATTTVAGDEADEDETDAIEALPVTPATTPTPIPTPTPMPTPVPTSTPVPPTATPVPVDETAAPEDSEGEAEGEAEGEPEDETVEPTDEAEEPALPTPTPQTVAVEPPICPDPRATIFAPGVGEVISGVYQMVGTATHINFGYYKVEYAQGAGITDEGEFAFLAEGNQQVVEGALIVFDTAELDNGLYTLKLTVVDQTGNFPPPCSVTVSIQN